MGQSKKRLQQRKAERKAVSKATQGIWDYRHAMNWIKSKGKKYRWKYRDLLDARKRREGGDYPLISSLIRYHFARNYRPGGPYSVGVSKK